MKKKKGNFTTFLLYLILLAGLSLLFYPSFSNYWNSSRQSQVINNYTQQLAEIDPDRYKHLLEAAQQYNAALPDRSNPYLLSPEQEEEYWELLDISGTGTMGYIEIPSIRVTLPIYHGTSDAVLQVAVGHLEWSSLPVGGESTHCLLSGHRGLPSSKLFTDLDQVAVGDVFILRVLDEVLTYEVDRIDTVEPHETQTLLIEEGQDLCTLITCTPYAINTHRLLVRGHRVENAAEAKVIRITSEAIQIEPLLVAPVVAMPVLLVLLVWLLIPKKQKRYDGGDPHL